MKGWSGLKNWRHLLRGGFQNALCVLQWAMRKCPLQSSSQLQNPRPFLVFLYQYSCLHLSWLDPSTFTCFQQRLQMRNLIFKHAFLKLVIPVDNSIRQPIMWRRSSGRLHFACLWVYGRTDWSSSQPAFNHTPFFALSASSTVHISLHFTTKNNHVDLSSTKSGVVDQASEQRN